MALPVMPHRRTVLAATCPLCGRLLDPSEFYVARGRVNYSKCRRCVSWSKARLPAVPNGRTVVAKSCGTCHELRPPGEFYDGESECVECSRQRARGVHGRLQVETLDAAHRRGVEWTGPELEIAARGDLTAQDAALLLGRTRAAVLTMRHKLRHDPKTQNFAGIPSG